MGIHAQDKMRFEIGVVVALVVGLVCGSSAVEDEDATVAAKLIGGYATRTRFSTITSSTFLTCVTTMGQGAACSTGRKKRDAKRLSDVMLTADSVDEVLLDSSRDERSVADVANEEEGKGKLFVALATFTTMTSTAFFDNTATTVSVSIHCIPPDGVNFPVCG